MQRISIAAVTFAFLAFLPHASAQDVQRTHDVTIDDYFSMSIITASAISPDAKQVAYAEARWQESTGDRKSDLWMVNVQTGKSTKLTADRCNPRGFIWSGDSKAIYFLANRKAILEKNAPLDGKTQVWRMGASGDLKAITEVEGGVEAFAIT